MSTVTSVVNHFPTANEGFVTTLGSSILAGAVTVPLTSVSGLTNGTIFVGIIEPGLANEQTFTGTVDTAGVQITGVKWTKNTNVDHTAGVTIVDYVSGTGNNMFTKGILVEHGQTGTHSTALITSRTEDTDPDPDADFVLTYDDSATALKKTKLSNLTGATDGWVKNVLPAVSSVTANGNRSYDITFASTVASTLSSGMRLRTTRTVAAPTYMGGLMNGSSHYFVKTTPTSTLSTVTNNFTLHATIQPTSYAAGTILARSDVTSANNLSLYLNASGQVVCEIKNGGVGNSRVSATYQSVPLNKKTTVTATFTSGTVLIYFDGISVPFAQTTAGTAPTTAGTGGDFAIGRFGTNPTAYFPGYISGVGVFDAVLSASTIKAMQGQALTGSETNCIGAWSLNNTAVNQQAPGTNDLTATGGVGYSTKSPYGNDGVSSTLDYALVMNVNAAVVTVQVPEGCTIPTSGGVTSVAYSVQGNPFGWVSDKGRWELLSLLKTLVNTTSNATYGAFNSGGWSLFVPGAAGWTVGWIAGSLFNAATTGVVFNVSPVVLTGLGVSGTNNELSIRIQSPTAVAMVLSGATSHNYTQTANSTYVMYTVGATTAGGIDGANYQAKITALPNGL